MAHWPWLLCLQSVGCSKAPSSHSSRASSSTALCFRAVWKMWNISKVFSQYQNSIYYITCVILCKCYVRTLELHILYYVTTLEFYVFHRNYTYIPATSHRETYSLIKILKMHTIDIYLMQLYNTVGWFPSYNIDYLTKAPVPVRRYLPVGRSLVKQGFQDNVLFWLLARTSR